MTIFALTPACHPTNPNSEHEFAQKFMGKWRYQPKLWPSSFEPSLHDLDRQP